MHTPTSGTHTCTHTDANTHTPGFALGFFLSPPFSSIAVAKLIFFAPNLLYLRILQQCQSLALTLAGMEYSYSYLYSYLLEYFFSVLSCTLYLAKFMSTCTRTYLSTVTKNPVLMSTLRVPLSTFFLKFNQIGKKVNCFPGPPSSV